MPFCREICWMIRIYNVRARQYSVYLLHSHSRHRSSSTSDQVSPSLTPSNQHSTNRPSPALSGIFRASTSQNSWLPHVRGQRVQAPATVTPNVQFNRAVTTIPSALFARVTATRLSAPCNQAVMTIPSAPSNQAATTSTPNVHQPIPAPPAPPLPRPT